MTDEQAELNTVREQIESELSELDATINEVVADLDAMRQETVTNVEERDTATEAFLPDEQVPESMNTETLDVISEHIDALGEKRDVRSETVEMKAGLLKAEQKTAADARDNIEEIAAVIDRLEDRTEEAKSRLEDGRAKLEDARASFSEDLAVLATRFETFDIDLSHGMLGTVIDERIPERTAEMQAAAESARAQVAELSARSSRLATNREELQSIDGCGTCPTCNQAVAPGGTENEVAAIEEEDSELERRLGAAKQERAEMIAGIEELNELRDKAIRVDSYRSETVAAAAGRVEDRKENLADLEADLEEERVGLAAAKKERDEADAAIATLESEIDSLETEIDDLGAEIGDGKACIEAFGEVTELRQQLETRLDELADLQEEHDEKETELTAINEEIEAVTE